MVHTKEELHDLFEYRDGKLFWKVARSPAIKVGDHAGSPRGKGYVSVCVNGKNISVHRIVFMMHHGFVPKIVDHIDGVASNNKIENLRVATRSENNRNRKPNHNNVTGVKNVQWNPRNRNWYVRIYVEGRQTYIGTYADKELAELVATEARDKFHKEFARHG